MLGPHLNPLPQGEETVSGHATQKTRIGAKQLLSFVIIGSAMITSTLACDLCGCYTPQLEAMPQTATETPFGQPMAMVMQSWRDRLYFALGEQFTYFNTVQVDGHEIPNETD